MIGWWLAGAVAVLAGALAAWLATRLRAARRRAGALEAALKAVQAEEGERAREFARLSGIVEALADPLLVVDQARIVTYANPAAVLLLGGRPAGRDLADSLRAPAVLDRVAEAFKTGQPQTLELVRSVPVERVFTIRVEPTGPEDAGRGAPGHVLLSLHDITAMKRIEQMRADFVANASHELRTPLSTLIGFIETLRGPARGDPAAAERFLGIMEEQAGRMSRLITDLLSLSRIELDEHLPPSGRVDIAAVITTVADALQIRALPRRITLDLQFTGPLPPVLGDADQLMQVFQNLIDNAVKYGRPGSTVTIGAAVVNRGPARSDPVLAVRVTDQGEGIAREHIPRLTERFYRVDPARSRAVGGTGLGLAIVKHIVNRHRGSLAIESEVGRGSTFTVFLPIWPAVREPASR